MRGVGRTLKKLVYLQARAYTVLSRAALELDFRMEHLIMEEGREATFHFMEMEVTCRSFAIRLKSCAAATLCCQCSRTRKWMEMVGVLRFSVIVKRLGLCTRKRGILSMGHLVTVFMKRG